jgi:hypothetical protein
MNHESTAYSMINKQKLIELEVQYVAESNLTSIIVKIKKWKQY